MLIISLLIRIYNELAAYRLEVGCLSLGNLLWRGYQRSCLVYGAPVFRIKSLNHFYLQGTKIRQKCEYMQFILEVGLSVVPQSLCYA